METLPEPTNQEVIPNRRGTGKTYMTMAPGQDGDEVNYKAKTLSDAMRRAREVLRDPDAFEDPDPDPYGYYQEMENEFGVDLITPNWKAKPDDERWVKRVKGRARKAAVAALYLQGHTAQEIAVKCKVSELTVMKDIGAIQNEWRKSYIDDIEILASRDLARLDEMFLKLWPAIENGDTKAVMAGTKIIEQRGAILGYHHGVSVDIEQHIREIAEARGFDPEVAVGVAQRISIRYK